MNRIRKYFFAILLLAPVNAWCASSWVLEEPGFYFITNNPYTEPKKTFQVALGIFFFDDLSAGVRERDIANGLQIAYGFTDRLEASLNLEYDLQWDNGAGQDSFTQGFDDTILGLRYRFLTEKKNPITLAFGPQLWLPTGNVSKGLGSGGLSLAWDLSLAKEWNRWFFQSLELNYATTFSAIDPSAPNQDHSNLHNFYWAVGLGFRPVEIDTAKGGHHDFHITLEFSGTLGESVSTDNNPGIVRIPSSYLFVPGVKYGYSTKNNFLTEIGLGGVIGLTSTPDWGLILQTQWEFGI
jgi:hypothetical protein